MLECIFSTVSKQMTRWTSETQNRLTIRLNIKNKFFCNHAKFLLGCVRCWVLFQSSNLTNSDDCMTASDTSSHTNVGRTSTKSLNQAAEERLLNYVKQNLHPYQLGKFQAVNSRKRFLMLSWVFKCRFQVWKYILNPGKRSKAHQKL